MLVGRSARIYTLFIDYLFTGRMDIADVLSIQEGFDCSYDYEGAEGIQLALLDYVCSLSLDEFK